MRSLSKFFFEAGRIVLPLGILAAGVIAFQGISSLREPPQRVEREETIPLVGVVTLQRHNGGLDIDVDGVVVPHREIQLSAEVDGRVTRKSSDCRAGRFVKAGTLLVEIDPRTYQLDVNRLTEEVVQADATLNELAVEVDNTQSLIALAKEEVQLRQRELERYQALIQQRASSESTIDESKRAELTARNNLTTLENQVRLLESRRRRFESAKDLAQAKLELAKLDVEKSQVRAPIDGVIVSEGVEENDFVQSGTGLCVIEDVSAAEVRCSLRMEELDWVWSQAAIPSSRQSGVDADYQLPQTPVTVTYQLANHTYEWSGTLWRYEGIGVNEATRTVPCRILVEHPRDVTSQREGGAAALIGPKALVRGMFVDVEIHTPPSAVLLALPERCVQPGNVVWRVQDGKLDVVELKNVILQDGQVLVPERENLLSVGDQIINTPLPAALDGMAVQIEEAPARTETPPVQTENTNAAEDPSV